MVPDKKIRPVVAARIIGANDDSRYTKSRIGESTELRIIRSGKEHERGESNYRANIRDRARIPKREITVPLLRARDKCDKRVCTF